MRNNNIIKLNKAYVVLFVIIAVQLFRIIYSFSFFKEDYHSDEAWSYGLANSYYEPFIFKNADGTQKINIDKWFSSELFRDYLTVSPEQRFSYGSVYYNQTKDNHPPLYYMILHTICSFFPGKFSFWYGFVINIAAFVILQFFLFKLSKEITGSDFLSVCVCSFFGFSTGAQNTFVFVRMYAMVTMFAVISAYLHTKLLKTGDFRKYLFSVFAVTLAGALTHHFYLIYSGALAACFCVYYLIKKNINSLIKYAVTLLLSAGTSVLIFPATISHLFGAKMEEKKFPWEWQFKYSINSVLNELFGLNISLFRTPDLAIAGMLVAVIILLLLPLCFLFRNELWFNNFIRNMKSCFKRILFRLKHDSGRLDPMILFMIISALILVSCTAVIVSALNMKNYIDRYNFMVFPLISLVFTVFVSYIVNALVHGKKAGIVSVCVILVLFCGAANLKYPCYYLFQKESSIPLSEVLEDSNIIYITDEHWLLTSFSSHCLDSEMFFSTTPEHLKNNEAVLSFPDNDKPVYLLIAESCLDDENAQSYSFHNNLPNSINLDNQITMDELENILKTTLKEYDFTYVGRDSIFERNLIVYKLRQ